LEVAFIYNEKDKEGISKAVYYDPIQNKSKLKFVVNREISLAELSTKQQETMKHIVNSFIGGTTDYDHGGNEDNDHTLLVTCDEGLRQVNYYYWKNDEGVPLGVEQLLEFLGKLKDCSFTSK
jgi:hypothetical protein